MYINLTIAREPAQIIVRNLLYLDIYITIISKYDVGGFNVAKNIDAKLKNIQGIFSNSQDSILGQDGCFIIPDYQRAYNWRFNEQCDKLWQDIESFIELAHKTTRKMKQNLFWGAGYNFIAIPLAAGILAPIGITLSPALGAILMSVSTVIVAINAMLLSLDPKNNC